MNYEAFVIELENDQHRDLTDLFDPLDRFRGDRIWDCANCDIGRVNKIEGGVLKPFAAIAPGVFNALAVQFPTSEDRENWINSGLSRANGVLVVRANRGGAP